MKEGEDFYYENGFMVLTAKFLLERGYCCNNDCRHCPYPKSDKKTESPNLVLPSIEKKKTPN